MYAAPAKIPVVYEPLPGMAADPRGQATAEKPSAQQVRQTIAVRGVPRVIKRPNGFYDQDVIHADENGIMNYYGYAGRDVAVKEELNFASDSRAASIGLRSILARTGSSGDPVLTLASWADFDYTYRSTSRTVERAVAPFQASASNAKVLGREMKELLNTSENLRPIEYDWERIWFADQPSRLTPERTHGGIDGPVSNIRLNVDENAHRQPDVRPRRQLRRRPDVKHRPQRARGKSEPPTLSPSLRCGRREHLLRPPRLRPRHEHQPRRHPRRPRSRGRCNTGVAARSHRPRGPQAHRAGPLRRLADAHPGRGQGPAGVDDHLRRQRPLRMGARPPARPARARCLRRINAAPYVSRPRHRCASQRQPGASPRPGPPGAVALPTADDLARGTDVVGVDERTVAWCRAGQRRCWTAATSCCRIAACTSSSATAA